MNFVIHIRHSLLALLLLLSCELLSQTMSYIRLKISNGLPSDLVYSALQDYRQILWFGTDKGIAKYDNRSIRIFSIKEGLPDPEVFNLFEDKERRMWANVFARNLTYLRYDSIFTSRGTKYLSDIELFFGIAEIFEDVDSSIWVATTTDIIFKLKGDSVTQFRLPNSTMQIHRIGGDLLGLGSGHIFDCRNPNESKIIFDIVKELGKIPKYVAVCASGERILYSFDDGLMLLEYKNGSNYLGFRSSIVRR